MFPVLRMLFPALALCLASPAGADEAGPGGVVVSVEVLTSDSDEFLLFRGKLILQRTTGPLVEYTWGGSTCKGRDLTETQVSILFDLATAPYMIVVPRWKPGQGGASCLVGFQAFNRKFD